MDHSNIPSSYELCFHARSSLNRCQNKRSGFSSSTGFLTVRLASGIWLSVTYKHQTITISTTILDTRLVFMLSYWGLPEWSANVLCCFDNFVLCFGNFVLCFDNFVLCFENFVLCFGNFVFCFDNFVMCFDNFVLCFDNLVLCFDNFVLCFDNFALCFDNFVLHFDNFVLCLDNFVLCFTKWLVLQNYCVVFQELFVVFADMGHRTERIMSADKYHHIFAPNDDYCLYIQGSSWVFMLVCQKEIPTGQCPLLLPKFCKFLINLLGFWSEIPHLSGTLDIKSVAWYGHDAIVNTSESDPFWYPLAVWDWIFVLSLSRVQK